MVLHSLNDSLFYGAIKNSIRPILEKGSLISKYNSIICNNNLSSLNGTVYFTAQLGVVEATEEKDLSYKQIYQSIL